jgi:NAD(P)-dependent dehydrogenase (short-subunit alcohol dehydrogenase family)
LQSTLRFLDQVVLVTGAAQGIGLAVSRAFLSEGARVALNDLTPERVQAARRAIGRPEDVLLGCPADVTEPAQVEAMVQSILDHWQVVDIAVNNAGVYPSRRIVDMSPGEWDRVMDVNAKGTFLVSRSVARAMIQRGTAGQIINISSGSYHRGREGSAHYCASKAAVIMFTRVLAMEVAPCGIRVNAVAPGLVDTGTLELDPAYIQATRAQIPAGRLGRPEDVAAAVVGLAAMDTAYITGAVLAVDGGLSLGRYGIPVG